MPHVGVIRFPGTNNEHETLRAVQSFDGVEAQLIDYRQIEKIKEVDGLYIAGGFSFGDVLRAGAIAASTPMLSEIKEAANTGIPILGVCNGFQILTESGLLPGALLPNATTRFICKFLEITVAPNTSYLQDMAGERLQIPIAHFEGNYWHAANPDHIAFHYTEQGKVTRQCNPNGSIENIAGISNGKNVVGLMPHPERAVFKHQGSTDGRKIIGAFLEACKC